MKIFAQKWSNDDYWLALTFLWQGRKFALQAFTREGIIELVDDLGAKVNKYSKMNGYIDNFSNIGQDQPMSLIV